MGTITLGGACGVMVIIVGNGQTLDKADFISHSTNILVKGMNPTILPPSIGR